MDWKHKARLQRLFSALPWSDRWNYLFQRYVTRSLPVTDNAFLFRARLALEILELLRVQGRVALGASVFYEFGVGPDLIGPVTFYSKGVEKQIVVDRSALVKPRLVLDTLQKARRLGPVLGFLRLPPSGLSLSLSLSRARARASAQLFGALRKDLGIEYRAPADARATNLPNGSVDVVTSNSTLEHVPPEEIQPLLAECRRILKRGGVLCMRVDYEDHYAYFDRRLSPYNFLSYSDAEWSKYNPPLHYQNRLRHSDYLHHFELAGLEVLDERRLDASLQPTAQLEPECLSPHFRDYPLSDLKVRKCTFLLKSG